MKNAGTSQQPHSTATAIPTSSRLFKSLSIASTFALIVSTILFLRSIVLHDNLHSETWNPASRQRITRDINLAEGCILFEAGLETYKPDESPPDFGRPPGWSFHSSQIESGEFAASHRTDSPLPFWQVKWTECPYCSSYAGHCFAINLFYLPLVFAILPASRLIQRLLNRAKLHQAQVYNLCPTCGYDLRATPTRCPECGAAPSK
jgi:hypothetical protein